jgi:hypothetical protein
MGNQVSRVATSFGNGIVALCHFLDGHVFFSRVSDRAL